MWRRERACMSRRWATIGRDWERPARPASLARSQPAPPTHTYALITHQCKTSRPSAAAHHANQYSALSAWPMQRGRRAIGPNFWQSIGPDAIACERHLLQPHPQSGPILLRDPITSIAVSTWNYISVRGRVEVWAAARRHPTPQVRPAAWAGAAAAQPKPRAATPSQYGPRRTMSTTSAR